MEEISHGRGVIYVRLERAVIYVRLERLWSLKNHPIFLTSEIKVIDIISRTLIYRW